YRITACRAPPKLAFAVVAGPARPTGVFALSEPVPGATTVHFLLDLQPRGLMKLPMKFAGPQIEKQMRAEVACLDKLKEQMEVLEGGGSPEADGATEAPEAPEAPDAGT